MKNEGGFTLIEMIVVVLIIGVIAAIAIPQYASYKARAVDAQVQSALKNATTAMEGYFVKYTEYSTEESTLEPSGYQYTVDVLIKIYEGGATDYAVRACKSGGTVPIGWQFNTSGSEGGQIVPATADCS